MDKQFCVVFVLQQKIHIAFIHAIVDCGFDVKDVEMLIDYLAKTRTLAAQLRARGIHVTIGIANRLRLMMCAQRLVVAKTNGN